MLRSKQLEPVQSTKRLKRSPLHVAISNRTKWILPLSLVLQRSILKVTNVLPCVCQSSNVHHLFKKPLYLWLLPVWVAQLYIAWYCID